MGYASDIDKMTKACVAQGERADVCKCSSVKWSRLLTEAEKPNASILINMMAEDRPPSPDVMNKLGPLLQKYQQVGMECAMNASYEEDDSDLDIRGFLPKGAVSDEDANNLNAIISGNGDVMENLQAMEERDKRKREQKRQAQAEEQAKSDAKRTKLRKKVNKEINRLEQTPILDKSVNDFKKLHKMRWKLFDIDKNKADCLWKTMKQVAGKDKSGVLATYFVGIGGGDFDQPAERKPYLKDAYRKYEEFMSSRELCDH